MRSVSLGLLLILAVTSDANDRKRWRRSVSYQTVPAQVQVQTVAIDLSLKVHDAMDEVNQARKARGLTEFRIDPLLVQAAREAALKRASSLIHGHLASDFDCLPPGGQATAAGCGALESSWGWGTCCTYDNYTYAGAAWVMGRDGRRYMHIFVR